MTTSEAEPRSQDHERHKVDSFNSKWPLWIAASAPFTGKPLYFHVLDVCEGAFMLVCDGWFSCFLQPFDYSLNHVLRRCVRPVGLLQSSRVTDDRGMRRDNYILQNTFNPVGGGEGV